MAVIRKIDYETEALVMSERGLSQIFGNEENTIIAVYFIRNDVNGKLYIGSSNNVETRWKGHVNDLSKNKHRNQHLQRSWRKYGAENFTFGVIEACDESDLLYREQWWLSNSTNLFNIAKNASAPFQGQQHTPEARAKVSASLKGNKRTLGYKHSEETIKKRIASGCIHKHSAETCEKIAKSKEKPIAQIDRSTGEVVKIWTSQTEAAKQLGINQRAISSAANKSQRIVNGRTSTRRIAGGYRWEFI